MQVFCNFLLVLSIFCTVQNSYALDSTVKENDLITLKADLIKYDDNSDTLAANGNVFVVMGSYILRADSLYYDIKKDVLFAEGNIRIKDEQGRIATGQRAVLKDKLKKALIDEFLLKLPDDSLIMAAYGSRNDTNKFGLYKAIFSPCKIYCANKPIWQMRAKDTDIDYEKQRITYKNMFFEVFGLPVAYFPYFFHPTPAADAKSGILVPEIARSKFALPIYFRAKPNLDFTLSPHMSKSHTIFHGELRHLIKYGSYEVKGSYTNHPYYKGEKHSKPHRYTIFAKGNFYKDEINYGFDLNRASDKAYLVNDFEDYANYLESKIYANKVDKTDYLSLEGYSFQGFRADDKKNKAPLVFPRVKVQKVIAVDDAETTLFQLKNNSIAYNEDYERQLARNALELTLSKKIITSNGHLFNFALANRSDLYWYSSNNFQSNTEKEKIWTRNIPEFHAKWRYPLVRDIFGTVTAKIEPIVAAFIGKNYNKNFEKFALIDVSKYELSEYNLFSSNKFSGIDHHDYGKRFSYGINGSLLFEQYYLDLFLGQLIYQNNINTKGNKDYVGSSSIDIANNLKLYYRFRKDKKLNPIRDEVGITTTSKKLTTSLSFSKLNNISKYYSDNGLIFPENKVSQISLSVGYQIFESLRVDTGAQLDITKKTRLLNRSIHVTYVMDCVSITGRFYDNFTHDKSRGVKKNSSKTFAIGLKVLNM